MSKEATQDSIRYSDWSALLGFMPEQEALNYIHGGVPNPVTTDQEWLDTIKKAREYVSTISNRSNLKPEIEELSSSYSTRIQNLQAESTFQEHLVGAKGYRFATIEIAKLKTFQVHLNLEYIESLVQGAPSIDDLEGAVKFSLPLREERSKQEILSSFNPSTNSTALVSPNLDFRVLGVAQGEDPTSGRKFTGFLYGFGLPLISVVEYKGGFMIKNGYHRAYALFRKGHTKLPCLLLSTDIYQFTGAQATGFFPLDLIMSEAPPLMTDFGSPAAVTVPKRRTRAVVNVHAEAQLIPL